MTSFILAMLTIWVVPAIFYGLVGQVMNPKSNGVHYIIKGLSWPFQLFKV